MLKGYFENFYKTYGILGTIAVAACMIKIYLFYLFIGIDNNAIAAYFVSCLLLYLFFACIKNKWIPAALFAVFSLLMWCDVMYSSFFNRYLSVDMIGAASVLGDITASIMEVFQIQYLLLFADVVLVFVCLIRKRKIEEDEKKNTVAGRQQRNKEREIKQITGLVKALFPVLIVALLTINITGSNFIKSVSNQEIITYHIKDFLSAVFAVTEGESLSAFEDTYQEDKIGPLFGIAEGRNLIVIQLESFQNFVVGLSYNGQEITPVLNKLLLENTAYFDNYYQQIGSGNTSDAEFASNNSIYGSLMSYTNKLYGKQNYFRGLPVMLKERGYDTAVFHANENKEFWSRRDAYPNMGFDRYYGGLTNRPGDGVYEMKEWMGWGLTDTYFYEQTIQLMEELKEPFYSYVISISNHHPYIMLDHYQFIEPLPEDEDTIVANYLNSAAYTDHTLGEFLEYLKEKGWYDNSVIAIFGDHVGLTHSGEVNASMEKLLGRPYDFDVLMNIPLLITIPGADDVRQTISVAGGQLDFFPTIAYLMGFPELDTLYFGRNLFNVKEGFVVQQTYMTKGSFFKNDIAFEMSRDGVFEHGRAWNLKTGEKIPLDECYNDYVRSMEIINTSEYVLKSDAIRRIFLYGEDTNEAFSVEVKRTYPDAIAIAGAPSEKLGNTIQDITYSHKHSERCIRIELTWTDEEEPEPIAVNPDSGEIEMTGHMLLEWMENHADTLIVVRIERSADWFMRIMAERSPAAAERLIVEVSELPEYTGKHDAIIDISNLSLSLSEIRDFVERNDVWAIMMTKEDAHGRFKSLLDLDTGIYLTGETDGFITKADHKDYKD